MQERPKRTFRFFARTRRERLALAELRRIDKLTQAATDLAAAINNFVAAVPAIVAALKSTGTPDSELTPLTTAITTALSEIQAALPPAVTPPA
jgi:hypothetical protein